MRIAEMGRLDDQQIADAADALIKRDVALARRVISADDRSDVLQRDIEEKAITTIARQPMAIDLREIVGALRISNDLKRVGDLAENIAKRVMLLADEFRVHEIALQLRRMARLARDQLSHMLHSYEHQDATEALDVWRKTRISMRLSLRCFVNFDLYNGGSAQHHVLHAHDVLRKEHRAHW